MASVVDITPYEKDPRLFLFTSLTAGSAHIITATSRLETILKANKIPFQAVDLATDEVACKLWQRRGRDRKLPGLVREGYVLGDLEQIEEWNEFGELKENVEPIGSTANKENTVKTGVNIAPPIPVKTTATKGTAGLSQSSSANKSPMPGIALPGAAEIAARNKAAAAPAASKPTPAAPVEKKDELSPEQKEGTSVIDDTVPPAVETMNAAPAQKEEGIGAATAAKKLLREEQQKGVEHLSAPPSGIATPAGEVADTAEEVADAAEEAGVDGGKAEKGEEDEAPSVLPVEPVTKEEVAVIQGKDENEDDGRAQSEETKEVEILDKEAKDGKETLQKEPESETTETPTKSDAPASVEATDAGEGKVAEEVKEQSAKAGDDAGKSVGD